MAKRLIPTGECWCGCGEEVGLGSYFSQGHDRFADSAIVKMEYGSVAEMVAAKGYGPGGRNLRAEFDDWQRR